MDLAVNDSDILRVHQIVWDCHQYRGKTFKVADQQRVQREFTLFNFISGESLPSLRRRLSELLEKMKNYDVSPTEFQIMYTFLMAAARYPNSHVQDICVNYLKEVDNPNEFPTDLSEVYEEMISTQDVVNQVANRGSQRQNHEGSVHQTALRQNIKSLQNKRHKADDKKKQFRKPMKQAAQVNSAYSNINKSVRKKLETHTLSGRPKNKFADEAVDQMMAANPSLSRGDCYKRIKCDTCGRYGHMTKDHKSPQGQSNYKPKGPSANSAKKSFRSKRPKKGRVNNTNGRKVNFQDDESVGWIGSVFAIRGTLDTPIQSTQEVHDDSISERSDSDSSTDKPVFFNLTDNIDKEEQVVFSSESSLCDYLDPVKSPSRELERVLRHLRHKLSDLPAESDSEYSYEMSSDEEYDTTVDVPRDVISNEIRRYVSSEMSRLDVNAIARQPVTTSYDDIPELISNSDDSSSEHNCEPSITECVREKTDQNRTSTPAKSSNSKAVASRQGITMSTIAERTNRSNHQQEDDSDEDSNDGRLKRSLPDEPDDTRNVIKKLPCVAPDQDDSPKFLLGNECNMKSDDVERSAWVDYVMYLSGRIEIYPFQSYNELSLPHNSLKVDNSSQDQKGQYMEPRIFASYEMNNSPKGKYIGYYELITHGNKHKTDHFCYLIGSNPFEFIASMYRRGISRFEAIGGMETEWMSGRYSETGINLSHIEELDERWRLFDKLLRQRIFAIQGLCEHCIKRKWANIRPDKHDMFIDIHRTIHKKNVIAHRDTCSASSWYHTITNVVVEVLDSMQYVDSNPTKVLVVTFAAFVKMNGSDWQDNKNSFAKVQLFVHVFNGIGHIFSKAVVIRDLVDRVHPRYIEYDSMQGVEFQCVHDLVISSNKGQIMFESSRGAVFHQRPQLSRAQIIQEAYDDFHMHNIPESTMVNFRYKNIRETVDKIEARTEREKYMCLVLFPGKLFYNVVIGHMYQDNPETYAKSRGIKCKTDQYGKPGKYYVLQRINYTNHEYLTSYNVPDYFEDDRNLDLNLRATNRIRMQGNGQANSIEGYVRYICLRDGEGYYIWYAVLERQGYLHISSEPKLYSMEYNIQMNEHILSYEYQLNDRFKPVRQKRGPKGKAYCTKSDSCDHPDETIPEPERIVNVGLMHLRSRFPGREVTNNGSTARIYSNGHWIEDTVDPPRTLLIIGDRWDRYDRRERQRITSRIYVLPQDEHQWRQIIIARDIDNSPNGRLNWKRVQDEYTDRFRAILEDPIQNHIVIICSHDGVENICGFDETRDCVSIRETPPSTLIPIVRDHVAEIRERDTMYGTHLPIYCLVGRNASHAQYQEIMDNLQDHFDSHEIAFENSGLPRYEYRLRYQKTIYDNNGLPPFNLIPPQFSLPAPTFINHPAVDTGEVDDDPDIKRLEELKLKAEADIAHARDVSGRRNPPPPPSGSAVLSGSNYLGTELRYDNDLYRLTKSDADWVAKNRPDSKEAAKARRRAQRKVRLECVDGDAVTLSGLSRTERIQFVDSHGTGCRKTDQILLNLDIISKYPNINENDSDNSSLSDDEINANKADHLKQTNERHRAMRSANLISQRLQQEEEEWVQQHRKEYMSMGIQPVNPSHKSTEQDHDSSDENSVIGSVYMAKHNSVSFCRKFNNHTWLALDTMANINVFRNPDLVENLSISSLPMNIDGVGEKGTRTQRRGVHPLFGEVWIVPENQYNIVSHYQALKNGFLLRMSSDNKSCWLVNKDKNVSVYFEHDPEDHFFKTEINSETVRSKAFALTAIENNQAYKIENQSMYYTQEQLRRAEIVEGMHVSMEHPSDHQLSAFLMSPSSINMPVTVQDLHNLRAIKGPCNACQEGRPKPNTGNNAGKDPGSEATQPGEELHCDIVFVQRNPRLFTVDHVTGYMTFTLMPSKHASDVLDAFETVINAYKSYLKVVRYVSCDHESVLKSLESSLNKLGVRLKLRLPHEHEKRAERAMRVVRERIRVKLRELPYKLPKKLFDSLAAECVRNINMMPNYRSMPHSPTELVRGDKINFLTDISPPFGSLVLCPTHGEQHKGGSEAKQEIAIALGPSNSNTRGGVLVYIPGRDNPVVRRNVRAMAMTSDIIDHMNKWAKELPGFDNSEFVFKDTIAC